MIDFELIEFLYGILLSVAELTIMFLIMYVTGRKKSNNSDVFLKASHVSAKYG